LITDYDKDRDQTRVLTTTIEAINVSGAQLLYFTAFYDFDGKVQHKVENQTLSITVFDRTTPIGKKNVEFRIMINEEAEGPFNATLVSTNVVTEGVAETYSVSGPDMIGNLCSAKRVAGQLGDVSFTLPSHAIQDIGAICSRMKATIPQDLASRIDSSYDASINTTRVKTDVVAAINLKDAKLAYPAAFYEFSGRRQTTVTAEGIGVAIVSDLLPSDAEKIEVRLIVDGKSEGPYLTQKLNTIRSQSGDMQVFVAKDGTTGIISRLSAAKKVVCQIEKIEFEFSPETLSLIRELYERMQNK